MMGEVVDDGNTTGRRDLFLTARSAAVVRKAFADRSFVNAELAREHIHGERVEGVHAAAQTKPKHCFATPSVMGGEHRRTGVVRKIAKRPHRIGGRAVRYHAGNAADQRAHPLAVDAGDERLILGQRTDQSGEGGAHVIDRCVDVGMIELDAGEDRGVRPVMDELRPLVEIGRVILVAFDDEVAAGASRTRKSAEVTNQSADQIPRLMAGAIERGREHAGRRRLAVGPRDYEWKTVFEKERCKRRRKRSPLQAQTLDRCGLRVRP